MRALDQGNANFFLAITQYEILHAMQMPKSCLYIAVLDLRNLFHNSNTCSSGLLLRRKRGNWSFWLHGSDPAQIATEIGVHHWTFILEHKGLAIGFGTLRVTEDPGSLQNGDGGEALSPREVPSSFSTT